MGRRIQAVGPVAVPRGDRPRAGSIRSSAHEHEAKKNSTHAPLQTRRNPKLSRRRRLARSRGPGGQPTTAACWGLRRLRQQASAVAPAALQQRQQATSSAAAAIDGSSGGSKLHWDFPSNSLVIPQGPNERLVAATLLGIADFSSVNSRGFEVPNQLQ